MIDVNKEIRRAVDTGKTIFGLKTSEKSILKGKGELIIISNNLNELEKERIERYCEISSLPFYEFNGSSLDLGKVCGKPFPISIMVILDAGKSKILDITKEKKEKTKKSSEKK